MFRGSRGDQLKWSMTLQPTQVRIKIDSLSDNLAKQMFFFFFKNSTLQKNKLLWSDLNLNDSIIRLVDRNRNIALWFVTYQEKTSSSRIVLCSLMNSILGAIRSSLDLHGGLKYQTRGIFFYLHAHRIFNCFIPVYELTTLKKDWENHLRKKR